MSVKRTTLSDDTLEFEGYVFFGEHSLDKNGDTFFKPREYAMTFIKNGNEEVLYKTRIQSSSSTRLIKIFVKQKDKK